MVTLSLSLSLVTFAALASFPLASVCRSFSSKPFSRRRRREKETFSRPQRYFR